MCPDGSNTNVPNVMGCVLSGDDAALSSATRRSRELILAASWDVRAQKPDRQLALEKGESPGGDEGGQQDQQADQDEGEKRAHDAAAKQDEEVSQAERKGGQHVEGGQVGARLPQDAQEALDPASSGRRHHRGGALQGSSR